MDTDILGFISEFMSGCAEFFALPCPFIPTITIFQLFAGFLILKMCIKGVLLIFGLGIEEHQEEYKENFKKNYRGK